jgi:peptide/nickel transport system substrate-binding protein
MRTAQKSWPLVLLLGLIVPILAACGGAPAAAPTTAPEAPAATEAPAAPAAPAAAEAGGDLKILYWQAITILNPHQATGTKDFDGASVILEPLARLSQNDEYIPYLAAEIPTIENGGVAEDGTSVTWKLKEGVKWSDGTDFTADDVIFTWQYCSNPETACVNNANFDPIENIEAVSPTEIKITWKQPNPNPYVSFTSYQGMIIQKAQFENCIGAAAISDAACQQANLAPIGTNAYKLREFRPGDTVVYEKNPEYRDADQTFFDTIEIKGGGDAASAARAVCETGEVDYAWNLQVPAAVLGPILEAGQCDAVAGGSFGIERIVVNFANPDPALGDKRSEPDQPHPSLTDPAVRKAISMAIDREAIAEQVYGPGGEGYCNILAVPATLVSTNLTCDRDVEGAKKLLDDAGWTVNESSGVREKDGVQLVYSFQTSINTVRQATQAIVKSNLAEVGITVNVKAVDAGVFFGGDPGNPDTLNKFYADLQMYTNSPEGPLPTAYWEGWTCAKVNAAANQWQEGNDGRYCNPEFDAIFEKFRASFDAEEQKELTIQMNDFLVNDGAIIPLINRFTPNGKAKNLEGPTYSNFDSVLWNIHTWKRTG